MQKVLNENLKHNGNAKVEYKEILLNNGLRVILSKDSSIPTVAINLCYHVGSKDEDNNKRGFAHFFEHLMFEGSKNLAAGLYDKYCVNAGGENNAYTTEDKTNYFVLMPSHQLELGLWLESDRMLGFAVNEESFRTQIEVITEEKNQVYDNRPYGSVSLEFLPRLFKKSGYRWDTIGEMSDLEASSLTDAQNFYEKYYIPNNAVLTLVGDIEFEQTEKLINMYFGSIPSGAEIARKEFCEDEITSEIKDTVFDNIQFPGIFIAYRVPEEKHIDCYALDVLSDILASGDSSRLYNELVYEKQICSEVGCYVDPKEFTGIFYIYGILMPGKNITEAENGITRILDNIKNDGVTETELQKIQNKIESRYTYKKQTLLAKADLLSHYKLFFNDPGLIDTNINNYINLSLSDIQNAANKYLNVKNRVVLHYLPKKN